MELWIRSQNREILTKVNNLRLFYSKDENIFVIEDYDDLGIYKTKERALEVLDDIQSIMKPSIIYNPIIKDETNWEDTYRQTVLKRYDVEVEQFDTYVYEMPKE